MSTARPLGTLSALLAVVLAAASCTPGPGAGVSHRRLLAVHPPLASTRKSAAPTTTTTEAPSCPQEVFDRLSPAQRVGQLFMVGLSSSESTGADDALIQNDHVGGVLLDGTGWDSAAKVSQATGYLQSVSSWADGLGLLLAGNQEGGAHGTFQAFYGPGFSDIPTALAQGALPPAQLRVQARLWASELRGAGINLDLAPVADVVPASTAGHNQAIGVYDRELGHEPEGVASHVAAFAQGMLDAGEQVTIKHFPGLGNVTGNTDFTASGITDGSATAHGSGLVPFASGIGAGANFVMVSLANYPQLDPSHQAVFSKSVIDGLLRRQLGFQGVVVSDDLGKAVAVAALAPATRALEFLQAGGDLVLTASPLDVGPMVDAVSRQVQSDPGLAQVVDSAVLRVLSAKQEAGLISCPAGLRR